MADYIRSEHTEALATITLDRAERHNALIPQLLDELDAALAAADADPGVRAVLLRGEGASFSTGGDLGGFLEHWSEIAAYAERIVGTLNDVILRMRRLPLPIVAAAQGWTTGGSLGLLLGADVVLMADDARIAPYYTDVGFSPDGGWTALLPAIIGQRRAAEIQLRNRTIRAPEAVEIGLAAGTVSPQALDTEAMALARSLTDKVPASVSATKALMSGDLHALEQALDEERRRFVTTIARADTKAAVEAFLGVGRAEKKEG